ncbi:MAG TPA: amidohydrolase family protein [Solirubrobacteraceae bacterium]|nr:amidohydrolase family protein [Solirubrobacteraceae bacterium]
MPSLVVDMHAHVLDSHALQVAGPHGAASGFGARPSIPPPGSRFAELNDLMLNAQRQVAAMDERGVDVSLISAILAVTPTGWATRAVALELNRRYNDLIAEAVRAFPSRLVGSFTVPLQDLELAWGELSRACDELELRVIQLPASIGGIYLGEPPLRALWDEIARRDLLVFIHPDGVRDPWFQRYSLWNSVGQPIEEAKVLSSLIYEGVLEDLPGLRIVVSHGGGYLPHYYGRLDRNVHNMPDSAVHISQPPSAYLKRLYYDTCVYEPSTLTALVAQVGAERLVMGSDWPVGEADPIGFVNRCPALDENARRAVLGGTAAGLLGLRT